MRAGHQFAIVPHRFEGLFIAEGVSDVFLTKNLLPGQAVYNNNRVAVQVVISLSILSICCYSEYKT